VVIRPPTTNAYEFVVVSALRAHQLVAGCLPLLAGEHRPTTMAQMEVASGRIAGVPAEPLARPRATDPMP
jgi:DNA-directed RNA polymerase subunit K/omega